MNTIYIPKAISDDGNVVYLSGYAGHSRSEVADKILRTAWEQDKFKGTTQERLGYLGWEIVKVQLIEIEE